MTAFRERARFSQVCLVSFVMMVGPKAHAQPAELYSCMEPGSYCSESALDTLTEFDHCGMYFYQFTGRLAWPVLVNAGPVTIAVQTKATEFTPYPLYIEIRGPTRPPVECTTQLAGTVVIEAQGFPRQCQGIWDSVGPIDLRQIGIPLGGEYHVQAMSFLDHYSGWRSVGIACIRVTSSPGSPSAVEAVTWGTVKTLFRDVNR